MTTNPNEAGMREIEGHIALVTGGSRGIGRAIATALAHGGARVAIVDINAEGARATAAELPGNGHGGFVCDVGDPAAANANLEEVTKAMGDVTILVNNAGITRDNLMIRLKDEDWDAVLSVNLTGTFNMTRAAARGMMKKRDGAIVNIASVVGIMGNAGQANYSASKAGVIGLTKTVARELASRNIRCNAIAPGFIKTDMTAKLSEQVIAGLNAQIPLARLGEPEDVAGVARFLAGPAARYITGQVLAVDGGMAM